MSEALYIDNSTLAALAACDLRAILRYSLGYTSTEDSMALETGKAVHTALEVYFKTSNRKQALAAFRNGNPEKDDDFGYEAWAAENVPDNPEKSMLWTLKYSFQNVRDIIRTWMRRHPLETELYKVFPDLVEIGFSYPLAEDVFFYGRYDAIVEEKASGQLFVLDHKAQPFSALILTPEGWQLMANIRKGSVITGADGEAAVVVDVYPQGKQDIYRVETSDGGVTHCTEDHLWEVTTSKSQGRWKGKQLLTLRQIMDAPSYVTFQLPLPKPIWYGDPVNLPLDPYVLGALIGDGYLAGNSIVFYTAEQEMIDNISPRLPKDVRIYKQGGANFGWPIVAVDRAQGNSVLDSIKALGLYGSLSQTHFIPQTYQRATPADRLLLLQGLMDTDGCIFNGQLYYDSVSPKLADGVVELVRSLGGVAWKRKRSGTVQQAYRVTMYLPPAMCPFQLARKVRRKRSSVPLTQRRRIKAITKLPKQAECQCIEVERSLYITDDFIVTHNTTGQLSSDWAASFRLSTQMTGYTWAAQQLMGERRVTGAIINGIQISKLPDILENKDGSIRKCREHGIGIDECRLTHVKESVAITQRTAEQIEQWKIGAKKLAARFQMLMKRHGTPEEIPNIQQQGMFSGACRYCDFKAFCEVGKPVDRLDQMLKFSPWRPYEAEEKKNG